MGPGRSPNDSDSMPERDSRILFTFLLTYCMPHSIVRGMVQASQRDTVVSNLGLEFRRGALVLAVLSQLADEQYGYSLKKALADHGLEIDEGTLYPLLRRLETQGLLRSRWRVEDGRPRRYYRVSPMGERMQRELASDWQALARTMERVLK